MRYISTILVGVLLWLLVQHEAEAEAECHNHEKVRTEHQLVKKIKLPFQTKKRKG